MQTKSVFLLLSLLLGCWAQKKSYDGYEVIQTESVSTDNLETLALHSGQWDFLRGPLLGYPAEILVAPEDVSEVKQMLASENISFEVVEKNVQRVLDEDNMEVLLHLEEGSITFENYITLSQINAYVDHLGEKYPQLASVQIIGNSTEGRPIRIIKISSGGENKPAIFIDATIHGREWMAPSTAVYLINQLVENYTVNRDLVDKADWYVLPVINVDGYVYAHTMDRFWRKTRSDTGNPDCIGVDGNRNYPYRWDPNFLPYACSEEYPGERALSEPEIQAVVNFAKSIKDRMKLYLTLHTFGPAILYPWGYTKMPIEDEDDLKSLGSKVASAAKPPYGLPYVVGSSAKVMYVAPGDSVDWFRQELGVKYSYTIELSSGEERSFHPPESVILPVVIHAFEMFKAFGHHIVSGGM